MNSAIVTRDGLKIVRKYARTSVDGRCVLQPDHASKQFARVVATGVWYQWTGRVWTVATVAIASA